jgi:Fe-S cluster assembly protein SufD
MEKNPFVALNSSFIGDGAFVHVTGGGKILCPIHLLFLCIPEPQPTVCHPRTLVLVDDDADVNIVESYTGCGAGVYFTNAVTEIIAGQHTHIDYCRMQQETLEAFHVSTLQVQLEQGADFVSHAATIGAKLTRNDVNVVLDGQGAHATLNGLVIIGGNQHVDNHTLLRHEKPGCPSHELYKHVLDGHASCVFKGKIFVQQDAQKTDAKQTSKSLLLCDDAVMNSQPALEIHADDVKCTHGSTIGPVDEDMVFYLRSRGICLQSARHLLTYAFAADITRRIRIVPVRQRLEDYMARQHGLPRDIRITDLGSHDEQAR